MGKTVHMGRKDQEVVEDSVVRTSDATLTEQHGSRRPRGERGTDGIVREMKVSVTVISLRV